MVRRRTSAALVVLAALAVAFAGVLPPRAPATPQRQAVRTNYLVLLARPPKRVGAGINPHDIYTMDDRGRHRRQLTHSPLNELNAIPSPDGRFIGFTRHHGNGRRQGPWIYLMRYDGTGIRRLARGELAGWSPDSKKLLYYRTRFDHGWPLRGGEQAGGYGIGVMKRDGSEGRALTTGSRDAYPQWSPDGRRILFLRAVGSGGAGAEPPETFVVIDLRRGTRRIIARAEPSSVEASERSWSPDGREILFKRFRFGRHVRKPGLYLMHADGTARREVLASSEYFGYAWSPTGRIGVVNSRGFLVLNRDGTHLHKVSDVPGGLYGWSPDGREVLFFGPGAYQYVVMNSNGTDRRTVSLGGGLVSRCEAWLPSLRKPER